MTTHAKIRIEDASDNSVIAETPDFLADYYYIFWKILDADYGTPIPSTVDVSEAYAGTATMTWQDTKLQPSSILHRYPHGDTYDTTWVDTPNATTKTSGYIPRTMEWTAGTAPYIDNSVISVPLQNSNTALMDWHVQLTTAYTPSPDGTSPDSLQASCWLEKKGTMLGGALINDLTGATLNIYDGASEGSNLLKTISLGDPGTTKDANGVFWFNWTKTGLAANRTYFVKVTIAYSQMTYTSGASINITDVVAQQQILTNLGAATNQIVGAVNTGTAAVQSTIGASTATMVAKIGAISYLGDWDFSKVYIAQHLESKEKDKIIDRLIELGKNRELIQKFYQEAFLITSKNLDDWLSNRLQFYSPLANGKKKDDTVFFDNGYIYKPKEKTIYSKDGQIPRSLFILEGNNVQEIAYEKPNVICSVLVSEDPEKGDYKCILLDRELGKSMFSRLYFFKGKGLKYFNSAIDVENENKFIRIYNINW